MRAALATSPAKPDQANEDFAAVSASAAVLLDGAGTPAGLESGCSHGVAWFARSLGSILLAGISADDGRPLADCLAAAITTVRSLHEGTCDVAHPGSPSATVVAVRLTGGELEYLVLADSSLVIQEHATGLIITDDREHKAGKALRSAMDAAQLATDAHQAALRSYVEGLRASRNQPGGFWVAAADPAAAAQALTGHVPVTRLATVILASDGATRLADRFGVLSWPELVKVTAGDGPEELIRRTRAAEDSDPDGQRWPRGKAHDDATVICLSGLG